MDELVRWLGEQLDAEAEEVRLTADAFGAVWTTDDAMESVGSDTGADVVSEPYAPRSFIAAHDPARALREIDAKRQLLAEHAIRDGRCRVCAAHAHGNWTRFRAPCNTLRLLAMPYANRPGYREEWRP